MGPSPCTSRSPGASSPSPGIGTPTTMSLAGDRRLPCRLAAPRLLRETLTPEPPVLPPHRLPASARGCLPLGGQGRWAGRGDDAPRVSLSSLYFVLWVCTAPSAGPGEGRPWGQIRPLPIDTLLPPPPNSQAGAQAAGCRLNGSRLPIATLAKARVGSPSNRHGNPGLASGNVAAPGPGAASPLSC